jgi:hypothetical protein
MVREKKAPVVAAAVLAAVAAVQWQRNCKSSRIRVRLGGGGSPDVGGGIVLTWVAGAHSDGYAICNFGRLGVGGGGGSTAAAMEEIVLTDYFRQKLAESSKHDDVEVMAISSPFANPVHTKH